MRGQDKFWAAACGAHRVGREFELAPVRAGENEFAVTHVHAVEFLRVVQAEESGFHLVRGGVLAHYESEVAAGALNTARRVELGDEANKHPVSLPNPGRGSQELPHA